MLAFLLIRASEGPIIPVLGRGGFQSYLINVMTLAGPLDALEFLAAYGWGGRPSRLDGGAVASLLVRSTYSLASRLGLRMCMYCTRSVKRKGKAWSSAMRPGGHLLLHRCTFRWRGRRESPRPTAHAGGKKKPQCGVYKVDGSQVCQERPGRTRQALDGMWESR